MGKKSRRVRDGALTSSSKTQIVLWKDGDTTKGRYLLDFDLSKTIGDLKAELEISTRVPFARQSIKVMRSTETGERELSDDLNVHKAIGPLEIYIMREKKTGEKKRAGHYEIQHDVPPPKPLSAYELFTTALEAQTSRAAVKADTASIAPMGSFARRLQEALSRRSREGGDLVRVPPQNLLDVRGANGRRVLPRRPRGRPRPRARPVHTRNEPRA